MATLNTEGISQYYELHGDPANTPVMLITGLGGGGASWGPQIRRFAGCYYVILPDHRGAGRSTHSPDGYTTEQLARDMVSLVKHLNVGPVHVVGSSTGGAIAQHMALQQPNLVRSLTLSSTFARFDAFTHREFQVRRNMAERWERSELLAAYSLFLFSPRYTREHPELVQGWINRAATHAEQAGDREIALKRIDIGRKPRCACAPQ
jgi:aminoacrylate hydrolase